MDYFKTIWLKRKAQRESDAAKNEAAQALTALSNSVSAVSAAAAAVLPLLTPVLPSHRAAAAAVSPLVSTPSPRPIPTPPPPPPVVVVLNSSDRQQYPVVQQSAVNHSELVVPARREVEEGKPAVIRHQQIVEAMVRPRDYYVELESFLMDGKMQPFTVSGRN
jgi:hypothetical protein